VVALAGAARPRTPRTKTSPDEPDEIETNRR
jgi:hypothetical protein